MDDEPGAFTDTDGFEKTDCPPMAHATENVKLEGAPAVAPTSVLSMRRYPTWRTFEKFTTVGELFDPGATCTCCEAGVGVQPVAACSVTVQVAGAGIGPSTADEPGAVTGTLFCVKTDVAPTEQATSNVKLVETPVASPLSVLWICR